MIENEQTKQKHQRNKMLLIFAAGAVLMLIFTTGIRIITTSGTNCPTSTELVSNSSMVCGSYTLVTPAGFKAQGGEETMWLGNSHWLPNHCSYSLYTLSSPTNKNLTVSEYNTSSSAEMIVDIPVDKQTATGSQLGFFEYHIQCGVGVNSTK